MGEGVDATFVLAALTRALSGEFGDMAVYNETPMQGAAYPYLYVAQEGVTQTPDNAGRLNRVYRMQVTLFPANTMREAQALAVGERLLACLRMIRAGEELPLLGSVTLHEI